MGSAPTEAVARFGKIDVPVANAGIASYGSLEVVDPEAFRKVIDINITGVFHTLRATMDQLFQTKGYALIVSSAAAYAHAPGMAPYDASKAGVEHMANAFRLEVKHRGVDVGSAHMLWIDTPLVRESRSDLSATNEMLESMPGPLRDTVSVEDCAVAFVAGGGNTSTDLWWRSAIPPGRGLGFSGAARVAGAVAGLLGVASGPHVITEVLRHRAFEVAAELEDHPDNAAASAFGGFVVAAGGHVIRVPSPLEVRFVVWSPDQETSTAKSRSTLPDMVLFDDAVFNVGRASLLVAAIVAGDEASLRSATEDRLHQDRRLERVPQSRAAFDAMSAAGALAVWLSGSGPTIAGAVRPDDVDSVVSRLGATVPGEGRTQVLEVAPAGVRCRS